MIVKKSSPLVRDGGKKLNMMIEKKWRDYALTALANGPKSCCGIAPEERWPGYLGPDYARGRVLLVGSSHNENALFDARSTEYRQAITRLIEAVRAWSQSKSTDGERRYLGAMREVYPLAVEYWRNGNVWKRFFRIP